MRRLLKLEGGIAQLGERLLCKQEVVGSIPSASTTLEEAISKWEHFDIGFLTDGCLDL